ncbi:MAG: hypothetical protein H6732_05370 [Alphaproteobacteria bacterium]|nr:hypothetical protein [Alphaproteobacteria bacterium]
MRVHLRGVGLALALQGACDAPTARVADETGEDSDPPAAPPERLSCPPEAAQAVAGAVVTDPRVTETSGLVASRTRPGSWWLHNDSGDKPRVLAIGADGAVVAEVTLSGMTAADVEDLTWLPSDDGDVLVLGDIGDNARARVGVWLVQTPPLDPAAGDVTVEVTPRTLVYGDDLRHDAETLLTDPLDGALYVVSKELIEPVATLYRATTGDEADVLEVVATVDVGRLGAPAATFTGGDISPDGRWIALRTYDRGWVFPRPRGTTVADALQAEPCVLDLQPQRQGESLAFDPQGLGLATLSEGEGQTLWTYVWGGVVE